MAASNDGHFFLSQQERKERAKFAKHYTKTKMTRDALNLGLMTGTYSGKYDLPTISSSVVELTDTMIPFNKAKTNVRKDVGVHFFIDDYQFERVWRSPQLYVEMLKKYRFVLAPDFSLYLDMPLAMKIWNVYRSRLVARHWQYSGVKVIPTLQWAEPRTFDFCFTGIDPGGTVAVSTLGAAKNKVSREIWKAGMREAIRQLHPDTILLYGTPIDFDFGEINIRHYTNEILERRSKYGR